MSVTNEAMMGAGARPVRGTSLWRLWVRQVDDVVARLEDDGDARGRDLWGEGLDVLDEAAAAIGARRVRVVAAKAHRMDRSPAGERARRHARRALRTAARLDARRAVGAA